MKEHELKRCFFLNNYKDNWPHSVYRRTLLFQHFHTTIVVVLSFVHFPMLFPYLLFLQLLAHFSMFVNQMELLYPETNLVVWRTYFSMDSQTIQLVRVNWSRHRERGWWKWNCWLITAGTPTKILTNCFNRDDVSAKTISGTGILDVLEPCDVTIDGRTLIFKNKIESNGASLTLVESTGLIYRKCLNGT